MEYNSKAKNMRRYVRSIAAMLVTVCLIFTLAGCGGETDNEEDLFLDGYEPPTEMEHTSLKFLFPGAEPRNWKKVKAELEERTSGILNASLDFKWIEYAQYLNLAKVLDASNEIYDALIVAKPEPMYPDFTVLAREGRLKDITNIFPESAPLLFSKYTSEELEYARVDGKLYAVPSLYPQARCTYLIVDDALFKKYNLPDITDYDKYELFLKTVKDNEPDLTPGTIANHVSSIQLFARASGYVIADEAKRLVYKWDDPEMKLVPWEKTPEFYEVVSRSIDWYKKGYLKYRPDNLKTASFILESMLTPPSDEPTTITFTIGETNEIKESNPMRSFHLYPEKQVQRENPMGSFHYNGSFVFPAASENTERVLQFLELVQINRDNHYLLLYGIEDEDYILSNGIPSFPQGMDYFNSSYMYWDGNWAFRNLEYMMDESISGGSEIATFREFLDKYSKYPPHGAFYPNYGPMQQGADERARILSELDQKLGRGEIQDISEVDAYIQKLDEMGSDELAEEAYKQMMSR
jgi:putative aldouronate transport system substrate-binding protein